MRVPFSQRTRWNAEPNRLSSALDERRRVGRPVLDLTVSNPTKVGLRLPADALAPLGDPAGASYDPVPFGLPAAREAVSEYLDGAVPASRIALVASTSEAYSLLFKLLCDPGDRVLAPVPSYPLFDFLARLDAVELDTYPAHYDDGWFLDVDAMSAHVGPRTRAVLLVSPNNPTGARLCAGELRRVAELCRARGLALVCDEVFRDYAVGENTERLRTLAGFAEVPTYVLGGLSKTCLAPQVKVGWIAASGPEPGLSDALERLEIVADTYLSVSTPAQLALPGLLARRSDLQRPLHARLAANRALLARRSAGSPVSVLRSDGGWTAVLRVPRTGGDEDLALELLQRDGVLVHPGWFYDFAIEGHVVLSLLPDEPTFAEGVGRLVARVANRL